MENPVQEEEEVRPETKASNKSEPRGENLIEDEAPKLDDQVEQGEIEQTGGEEIAQEQEAREPDSELNQNADNEIEGVENIELTDETRQNQEGTGDENQEQVTENVESENVDVNADNSEIENAEAKKDGEDTAEDQELDYNEIKLGATGSSSRKEAQAAKRKARHHKHDSNLIPEEEDDENVRTVKSPLLEPVSQNLDRDMEKGNMRQDFDLIANTPDKIDVTLDDEYQEIEIEAKPTREELIAKYQSAIEERERLQNFNSQLHHKLADYFRKRKSEDTQNQPLFDKSNQEQEQRYLKYLTTIENLKKQIETEKLDAEQELNELKDTCELKKELVDQDRVNLTKIKKGAALKSYSTQTGKPLTGKELEALLDRERQKELEVISVRIENLKLNNQLKKKNRELRSKEEFGEGLHMIDFEQLKIENQTYNEKIEERNEELMKLKKKINNTVQILSHVKEKLQFVTKENEKEKDRLAVYDNQVKNKRDSLNKIKQSKDSLRLDNARLRQKGGLLGNNLLLRDFEDCIDHNDELENKIEHLKRKHAELMLTSRGIKQKINQAKADVE